MSSPNPPADIWNGRQLAGAFGLAASWLDANREHVNALNVFPVPDGDTGTNMAMTLRAAVDGIAPDPIPAAEVARQLAYGALLGARGNSGVILSQIFRGFANGIQDREAIDGQDLARALESAQLMAYKAVMRPVEGTMLTVIRGAAERAAIAAARTPSLTTVLGEAIAGARDALAATPTMLDILRQAGVVDAGGQGIVIILEGLDRFAHGETEIAPEAVPAHATGAEMAFLDHVTDLHGEDAFGYCTNFMVFGAGLDFDAARDTIAAMGQSAVIVGDETMLKVHIHTENPGQILAYAVTLGALDQIKIDNMTQQTDTLTGQRTAAVASDQAAYHGRISVVAVASGDGLGDALRTMGATTIVRGGQTMNPSTKDLLQAVDAAPTADVIVLPNNKNIMLAANQVAALTDRNVRVVPTISVPQALAALASFSPDAPLDANVETMTAALEAVTTLELTRAVRDVELDGIHVGNGQTIGLIDDRLVAAGNDVASVARALFGTVDPDAAELVTVFAGEGATGEDIAAVRGAVETRFPDAQAEYQDGGQPHYLFVISVE